MPRRVLLVLMAVALSYILTAVSGYALYKLSGSRSEAQLSLMVRFIFNPAIALIIGFLVGLFSKDYPAPTAIVGLVPWALMLGVPAGKGALTGKPLYVDCFDSRSGHAGGGCSIIRIAVASEKRVSSTIA